MSIVARAFCASDRSHECSFHLRRACCQRRERRRRRQQRERRQQTKRQRRRRCSTGPPRHSCLPGWMLQQQSLYLSLTLPLLLLPPPRPPLLPWPPWQRGRQADGRACGEARARSSSTATGEARECDQLDDRRAGGRLLLLICVSAVQCEGSAVQCSERVSERNERARPAANGMRPTAFQPSAASASTDRRTATRSVCECTATEKERKRRQTVRSTR